MSLILFLCNEAIILYNLGQPEGLPIKYSGLMGRRWCTWWTGCWGEAEKGIYCPLIYRIFALNCWLDGFKRNYHLGSFHEHINLVVAGPRWVLWGGGRGVWRSIWLWISECACSNKQVMPRLCLFFQGVQEQVYKWGDTDVLYEGDGGGHHPLWPCAPRGSLLQNIQDWCKNTHAMLSQPKSSWMPADRPYFSSFGLQPSLKKASPRFMVWKCLANIL